jgi:hypothetical protein
MRWWTSTPHTPPPHTPSPQSLLVTPRHSSSLLVTPRHSSSLLVTPRHSSSLLLTPPHSSSLLPTPPHSSPLLLTPPHSQKFIQFLISHKIGCIDHYTLYFVSIDLWSGCWCQRYYLAELSWLSPFAANFTDCYSHCCCAAAMAILRALMSSCSLGRPQTVPASKH